MIQLSADAVVLTGQFREMCEVANGGALPVASARLFVAVGDAARPTPMSAAVPASPVLAAITAST